MGLVNFLSKSLLPNLLSNKRGSVFSLQALTTSTQFNELIRDKQKLAMVLSNPAVLKAFSLNCDLFSMGKVYLYDNEDNIIEQDPILDLVSNPNPFQTGNQMLWDYMFWSMIGTAYMYVDSKLITKPNNRLYFLEPFKMEWPQEFQSDADKLIFSDDTIRQRAKKTLTYRYADGSSFSFPLERLITMTDLTNGVGNWYKGPSRLEALYKVISNSEHALDAKNINVRYSGKFMVAGTSDPRDTTRLPLSETEKNDIETKMNGDKSVHAMKSLIEVKRFVENMQVLDLNKAFMDDYYTICLMYGIPKDIAEAFALGSTYENQEKATMRHVSYSLQPKADELMSSLTRYFGYDKQNKKLVMDWSHLPFMQVFEESRSKVEQTKIASFKELISMGVSVENANQYLDTEFELNETNSGTNQTNQSGQDQSSQDTTSNQEVI